MTNRKLTEEQMYNIMALIADLAMDAQYNGKITQEEFDAIRDFCINGAACVGSSRSAEAFIRSFAKK